MNEEEFDKWFGKHMLYSCQRTGCFSCVKHECQKRDEYPCRNVLPAYILTVLEKRWQKHQQQDSLKRDPKQGKLW